MRHYRHPETGELVAFDLAKNAWFEMRCDSSTDFEVRWLPVVITVEQARTLTEVSAADASREAIDTRKANSAARGQRFTEKMGASLRRTRDLL